ncbi:hypothetical protein C7999DRAFT_16575 [Corynascus novoguineensis]|uniref:Uncharacterized protein n=1 Tax=Corynascus novoguineensis TaxID=1126955 RepID=A0AAN7CQT1_9PEZI|nr:hypothetical protein C7999DRAFT_16575 [Corynascus novoguineensis]
MAAQPGERDAQALSDETRSTEAGNPGLMTTTHTSRDIQRGGAEGESEAHGPDEAAVSVTGFSNFSVDLSVDHDGNREDELVSGSTTVSPASSASASSSVYRFVQENGRTYHRYKEGSKLPLERVFARGTLVFSAA